MKPAVPDNLQPYVDDVRDFFPSLELINAAGRAGVEVRLLGSDAHAPNQVGHDFDTAAALVSPWSEAWCED